MASTSRLSSVSGLLLFAGFLLQSLLVTSGALRGAVLLDSLNFDKVISKFDVSLVKLDVQYPYGEKHDEFGVVAKELVATPQLLIAEIGVQDFGEKENEDLATRYGANKDDFPVLLLFKGSTSDPVKYTGEFKADRIKSFLRQNTGIRLLLDKCIEALDRIVESFIASEDKTSREKLLEQAKTEMAKLESDEQKKSADIYVKLMQRVLERGNKFVESEQERVKNLLEGKISEAKKIELRSRVNILQSFLPTGLPSAVKAEL